MPPSREFEPLLREIARMERDIARLKTVEGGGGGGGGGVVAVVDLTGQTADITETNFDNTITVGMYRLNVYMVTTTADAGAGDALLTISWTDEAQAKSSLFGQIDLYTLGDVSAPIPILFYVASGSISYEVAHTGSYGSAVYSLHMRVERLPAQAVEDSEPVIVYTTDATPTTIASVTPAANSTTLVAGYIVAHRTGGDEGTANINGWWSVIGVIKNDGGNLSVSDIWGSEGIYGYGGETPNWWAVQWDETPAGTIVLQVTGAVDNNITWEWIQSRLLPEVVIGA